MAARVAVALGLRARGKPRAVTEALADAFPELPTVLGGWSVGSAGPCAALPPGAPLPCGEQSAARQTFGSRGSHSLGTEKGKGGYAGGAGAEIRARHVAVPGWHQIPKAGSLLK